MSFVKGSDYQWHTGWAVAGSGKIYKTTNGGDSWTETTQSLSNGCNGICFIDENTGFISTSKGKILKSTDGGDTWTAVYDNSGEWFGKLAFKDSLNGVVAEQPTDIHPMGASHGMPLREARHTAM